MNIIIGLICVGIPITVLFILFISVVSGEFVNTCSKHIKFNKKYKYAIIYMPIFIVLLTFIILPFTHQTSEVNKKLAEQNVISVSDTMTGSNKITVKTDIDTVYVHIRTIKLNLIADVVEHPDHYKIVYYIKSYGFLSRTVPVLEKR